MDFITPQIGLAMFFAPFSGLLSNVLILSQNAFLLSIHVFK